jgi:hypothetical protein
MRACAAGPALTRQYRASGGALSRLARGSGRTNPQLEEGERGGVVVGIRPWEASCLVPNWGARQRGAGAYWGHWGYREGGIEVSG